MNNPFKYGKAVGGEFFTDREKEKRDLAAFIDSAQNVFIFANRRLGKTSLIKAVLSSLAAKKEVLPIYVDLEKAPSPAQFVQVYGEAIGSALIVWKEKMEKVARFFSRIIPSFEISKEGNLRVSFDFSKTQEKVQLALEEIYDLPQKIAQKYKKRVVVVFDEFQEIENLDGEHFEKKLRSFIQHHPDVCYIFMGSKTRVMIDMFNNPRRAFYKSAATYPLGPIPEPEMADFIIKRFSSTRKIISGNFAERIIKSARNIPYYIQMYSWHVWNISSSTVTGQDCDRALEELLHNQNDLFFNWYDGSSMNQRAVLLALSQTNEIFSQEVIIKHNLSSSSSIQASLRKLLKSGLVNKEENKYKITDPFFELWLREQSS